MLLGSVTYVFLWFRGLAIVKEIKIRGKVITGSLHGVGKLWVMKAALLRILQFSELSVTVFVRQSDLPVV